MPLAKLELICNSCDFQYIVVTNEEDITQAGYCPFCGEPVEAHSYTKDETEA